MMLGPVHDVESVRTVIPGCWDFHACRNSHYQAHPLPHPESLGTSLCSILYIMQNKNTLAFHVRWLRKYVSKGAYVGAYV